MNERIRQLRKRFGLTQKEFAKRIGIKQNTVATYELGRSEPIDAVVSLICHVFNVNEDWLRTGNGAMFKGTEEAAVNRLCEELHATPLEMGIIRSYFRIDPEIRESFMRRLMDEIQLEYNLEIPGIKYKTSDDITADLEDWHQEILAERAARENGQRRQGIKMPPRE